MINLQESNLIDLIPLSLAQKPEVQALCYALDNAHRKFMGYIQNVSIWDNIDNLNDEMCDILAICLDTQYYSTDLPLETKRELVKNTFSWYSKAGTPSAVEELISVVFGEGKVLEHWETGGEPYTFDIETNARLTEDTVEYLSNMITRVKAARSKLRAVRTHAKAHGKEYVGAHAISRPITSISNAGDKEIKQSMKFYIGSATLNHTKTYIKKRRM